MAPHRTRGLVGVAAGVILLLFIGRWGAGIAVERTYPRGTNPQLFPSPNPGHSTERALLRKLERIEWGMLRGMVETANMNRE